MAFVSLSSISEASRGIGNYRTGRMPGNRKYLVIGTGSGGKDSKGVTRKSVVVRISAALAKEARILHGDRLDLLIDKDAKIGLLKRINKGGYAASATGKKQETIKPGKGSVIVPTLLSRSPMYPTKGRHGKTPCWAIWNRAALPVKLLTGLVTNGLHRVD